MALSEKEQEELKTLQEDRKAGRISDSGRVRLTALTKQAEEGKESKQKTLAASAK